MILCCVIIFVYIVKMCHFEYFNKKLTATTSKAGFPNTEDTGKESR